MKTATQRLTPEECAEADTQAMAACLLYGVGDVRRFETFMSFLLTKKCLVTFYARVPWWDRFYIIARSLHGEGTHDQSRTREAGTVLS